MVSDINRNVILGRDWLVKNGVWLYYDLGMLRVGNVYANLEEDIHISSIVGLSKKTILKPQTSNICFVKIKRGFELPKSKLYEILSLDKGGLSDEPGILIGNAIVKIENVNKVPIHIVNNTNKTFRFKRGTAVGKINGVLEENLVSLEEELTNKMPETEDNVQINVPSEHKQIINMIIDKNKDIFAVKDSDLGHTDTVKMEIETGDNPPVKLKLYRTPLHKRPIVDKAINEMLEAGVIRRSKSSWCSPIVIVKKKIILIDFAQILDS